MPDLKPCCPSNIFTKIVLKDIPEAHKITFLKEEFAKTPLDPVSKEAAALLHETVWHGLNEVFLFLISEVHIEVNIRSTTINKRLPFANAAFRGHISILKELVKQGADDKSPDANGYYPLHLAIEQGHHETVKYLIKKCNADINQRTKDQFGTTPFLMAINCNKFEVMQTLLELGADPLLPNLKGSISLSHIKSIEQKNLFIFLINELKHHELFTSYGFNGIHSAAEFNLPEMIEYLVKAANVDIDLLTNNDNGSTAFHIGVLNGSIDALKKLVELGADFHLPNKQGLFPIHLAHCDSSLEYLVNTLHVNIHQESKDEDRQTALFDSIEYNKPIRTFHKLVELKADINAPNKNGWYPLHMAVTCGRNEMVASLLDKQKEKINQVRVGNTLASTALTQAIHNQYINITRLLLEQKGAVYQGLNPSKGLKKTFHLFANEAKKKNESLVLMAMQDLPTRLTILECAIEKNLLWLAMALYHPKQSGPIVAWSKKTSADQYSLLCCIAAHYDFREFNALMDAKDCPQTVKNIIESDGFKHLAHSEQQFLNTKNAMYYEVLHIEDVAKLIQKILYVQRNIFLKLPNVLFDLVFGFILDPSLCKTKPAAVLQAMSTSSGQQDLKNNFSVQRALFFKKLTPSASCDNVGEIKSIKLTA